MNVADIDVDDEMSEIRIFRATRQQKGGLLVG